MKIPSKMLKNGFSLPVYGLGTWGMGGKHEHSLSNDDEADIKAIQTAIDMSITHIDTAEAYADGFSEILVGKAIQNYNRDKLLLASKVHVEHLGYDNLINAAKASIKRLQTSYIDVYFTHRYSLTVPIKETMRALDTLIDEGIIRHIGVSNYNASEIEEAQSYTKNKIVAVQNHYNLKYRESEKKGVLEYCQKHDILFVAWRPLQKGLVTEGDTELIENMAKKYNKTPLQISLNWLLSQKNVVAISKTTSRNHLEENLGALGWTMDETDIENLRKNFPNQELTSDTVPLH